MFQWVRRCQRGGNGFPSEQVMGSHGSQSQPGEEGNKSFEELVVDYVSDQDLWIRDRGEKTLWNEAAAVQRRTSCACLPGWMVGFVGRPCLRGRLQGGYGVSRSCNGVSLRSG